jgi:hypothetical protein
LWRATPADSGRFPARVEYDPDHEHASTSISADGQRYRTDLDSPQGHALGNVPETARDAIAAAGFFTVEVLIRTGLVRFLVFFVIDVMSRRVKHYHLERNPQGLGNGLIERRQDASVSSLTVGLPFSMSNTALLPTPARFASSS